MTGSSPILVRESFDEVIPPFPDQNIGVRFARAAATTKAHPSRRTAAREGYISASELKMGIVSCAAIFTRFRVDETCGFRHSQHHFRTTSAVHGNHRSDLYMSGQSRTPRWILPESTVN